MKDDKYLEIESLLYSYKKLPYEIKGLEIKTKLDSSNEEAKSKLEKKKLVLELINNMLEFLESEDKTGYKVILYRYIEGESWAIVAGKLAQEDILYCERVLHRKAAAAIKILKQFV